MNRIKILGTLFAFSLLLLAMMPSSAAAQYGTIIDDIFRNRNTRDRNDRYRDGYAGEAIRRVENRSEDFRRTLDRALDNSRYDGRRGEDRILDVARDFQRAASRLENAYDDGRNMRNSADEARELLRLGSQIDNLIYSRRLDGRVQGEWSSIRSDLQTIADAYGYNFGYRNDRRRNRDDDWRRDRNRDDDDDYDRNNRRRRNDRFPY